MPKTEITTIEAEETVVDVKATVIRLTTMAAVTAATLVATHFAIKALEKKA